MRGVEILSDGETVWVNADDGVCIGRFSQRGVDVHHDVDGQIATGRQCLVCIHDLPHAEAWDRFRAAMLAHYGVDVSEVDRTEYAAPWKPSSRTSNP